MNLFASVKSTPAEMAQSLTRTKSFIDKRSLAQTKDKEIEKVVDEEEKVSFYTPPTLHDKLFGSSRLKELTAEAAGARLAQGQSVHIVETPASIYLEGNGITPLTDTEISSPAEMQAFERFTTGQAPQTETERLAQQLAPESKLDLQDEYHEWHAIRPTTPGLFHDHVAWENKYDNETSLSPFAAAERLQNGDKLVEMHTNSGYYNAVGSLDHEGMLYQSDTTEIKLGKNGVIQQVEVLPKPAGSGGV